MKKLFFFLLVSTLFFACSKDKNGTDDPPATIDGYWIGTWSVNGRADQNEIAVVLRDNGTMRILTGYVGGDTTDAIYISEDQFTYNDGTVRFQSRESSYTYSYQGAARGNTMSGTWGELPSYDDRGTWTMNKQ